MTHDEFLLVIGAAEGYIRAQVAKEFGEGHELDNWEDSDRAAKCLVSDGDYRPTDNDLLGTQMRNGVQKLLTMAIMLQPDMVDAWLEKGVIHE